MLGAPSVPSAAAAWLTAPMCIHPRCRKDDQLHIGNESTRYTHSLPGTREYMYAFIHVTLYYSFMSNVTLTASVTHTAALARLGHALSDSTRAGVLLALREAPAYPSDLADALGVSRQVMSNQLACLRGCGLVEAVPDGRRTWYRLADAHLAPALDELLRVVLYVEPGCCAGESCTCT